MTLAQTLQQAVNLHRAGRLDEAEKVYKEVLRQDARQSDANFNLGVIAMGKHAYKEGVAHFRAALEARPEEGQYWMSYMAALVKAADADGAREVMVLGWCQGLDGERVMQMAKHLLENAVPAKAGSMPSGKEVDSAKELYERQRYVEAEIHARILSKRYPDSDIGWALLGVVLTKLKRHEEAKGPLEQAVQLAITILFTNWVVLIRWKRC